MTLPAQVNQCFVQLRGDCSSPVRQRSWRDESGKWAEKKSSLLHAVGGVHVPCSPYPEAATASGLFRPALCPVGTVSASLYLLGRILKQKLFIFAAVCVFDPTLLLFSVHITYPGTLLPCPGRSLLTLLLSPGRSLPGECCNQPMGGRLPAHLSLPCRSTGRTGPITVTGSLAYLLFSANGRAPTLGFHRSQFRAVAEGPNEVRGATPFVCRAGRDWLLLLPPPTRSVCLERKAVGDGCGLNIPVGGWRPEAGRQSRPGGESSPRTMPL
ncbi:uncharacterized protein [Narcine bancroftii]|uniref:uncharacterized protein n=1 Tax=Narcine bancroftii TaxID=1343680 RepID=UPI00383131FF